jgi:hypothetical protein
VLLLAGFAGACHGGTAAPSVPERSCSLTVWYQPASTNDSVHVVGSWDGWSRPGRGMDAQPGGWLATRFDDLGAGSYQYAIDDDGTWVLDPNVGTTAFHEGQEVTWVTVPDCGTPATQVSNVTAGAEGTASIDATFLAATTGDALDPASLTLETLHGATPTGVTPSAVPSAGTIHLDLSGLPPGKSTLAVHARDVKGRDADAAIATVWTEPRTFDWRDAVIYEVMVDRYRARDGSPLPPPASMGGRAGGSVGGVQAAIESGELASLGVNTIWLTPLYANPEGEWPGLDGRPYTAYHGYWPAASRATEPSMADEADVDALVASAHAHDMRILFDVVPHHVHLQHPYWVANDRSGWFQDIDGSCVCGVGSCSWATSETACWFTSYMPTLDWTNDAVASAVSSDVAWWIDRFDGDGVRIDAVPMMPRAAVRRIAADLRATHDNPSHRTYVVGENYVSQGDFASLLYYLGPQGIDGEFHFPLMWALQAAFGDESESLVDVDSIIHLGEQTWAGSGAVMGLILDKADKARFSSVVAGDGAPADRSHGLRPDAGRARSPLLAARGADPLLRRRGRAGGRLRPRLPPRHAGGGRPGRAADPDARRRPHPRQHARLLGRAAKRDVPDALRRSRAPPVRPGGIRRGRRRGRRPAALAAVIPVRAAPGNRRGSVGRRPVGAQCVTQP